MAWVAVLGTGFLLQSAGLFRGFKAGLLLKFCFFYGYLLSTALGNVIVFALWRFAPASYYRNGYWFLQFATLLIGCGIILEIFRHSLSPYRGAEKFATAVGLCTFGAVFCFAIAYRILALSSGQAWFELERNVRTVQAVLLLGILAVISYYRIPLGKNLRGMITGYGLYIVTSLSTLAIRAHAGPELNSSWNVIQPLSFDLSLTIWLIALWSCHPNPDPDPAIPLEDDYELLATRTKRALASVRSHLSGRR